MKSFKLTLMTFAMIVAATSACSGVETSTPPEEAKLRSVLETEGAQYVDDLETALSTKDSTQDANGAGAKLSSGSCPQRTASSAGRRACPHRGFGSKRHSSRRSV